MCMALPCLRMRRRLSIWIHRVAGCADGSDMGGKYGHRMVELDGVEVKSRKAQERFFGWT